MGGNDANQWESPGAKKTTSMSPCLGFGREFAFLAGRNPGRVGHARDNGDVTTTGKGHAERNEIRTNRDKSIRSAGLLQHHPPGTRTLQSPCVVAEATRQ